MNNDNKESSNQLNTTPFNNRDNVNVSNNENNLSNKYKNAANIINNSPNVGNINKSVNYSNLSDMDKKQRMREITDDIASNNQKNINNSRRDTTTSKPSGLSSAASNLRNKLNTTPKGNLNDKKNEAIKKGVDSLKKSTNLYTKAAGYAASAIKKRKDKKDKEKADKNEEEKNDSLNEEVSEDNNTSLLTETKGSAVLKKLLPIIMTILPFILVFILILSVLSPVISAYSWFTSLFHHKDQDNSWVIYDEDDTENHKAEQDYNNAILGSSDGSVKGIVQEYQDKYGVTIDWYLLNALITYRYVEKDNENAYSSDGGDDISEDEINERLENLESSSSSSEEESESTSDDSAVDWTAAKKKIKAFASLLVVKEDGSWTTDKEKDGKVYNQILNSSTFTNYYKSSLVDNSIESKRKLLDTIYDYAEGAREILNEDTGGTGAVIGDTSIVHVQTCAVPYTYTYINEKKIYNNPVTSEGTDYPDYLNMKDYIKGVLMTEVGGYFKSEYKEGLKAMSIAALTFIIHDSKSGFDLKSGEMYFPSGNCRQVACDPTNGCSYLKGKTSGSFGTAFVGLNRFGLSTGQHKPLSESNNELLEEVLSDVFGKVMAKKGITSDSFTGSKDVQSISYYDSTSNSDFVPGHSLAQVQAMSDAKSGMSYTQILAKYYYSVDYDIINITEGLYFETTEDYSGTINLNENYHYHQGNYRGSNSFCEGGTISARGCSVTATAIAVSLLTNQKHDPLEISSRLKSAGRCNGDRVTYAASAASLYDLKSYTISKKDTSGVNRMLNDLASGNTVVVARMAKNSARYKTESGHYIALVGVKTEGGKTRVLVWDPAGNLYGRQRDNYWADFNEDILKYTNIPSFVVLSRR